MKAVRVDAQVCQHHAAAVADGSGCAQLLRCSYHGWEYGGLPPVCCPGHMLAQHSCAVSCYIPRNFTCQDTEISKPHVGKAFPGCEPYARVEFEIRTCLCVGLNGRLKKAPGADGIQNFHADQIALKPIGLAVLGHLIFVHFGESGAAIFVQYSCQTHQ